MNNSKILKIEAFLTEDKYSIQSLVEKDLEILRKWKNDHKEYFFLKRDITSEEQIKWFNELKNKPNDHMLVIFNQSKPIGCIGLRLYNENVDLYNIILGDKSYRGKYIMSDALCAVVALSRFLYTEKQIIVRVLKNNPAIKWYEKYGFLIIDELIDHVIMKFDTLNNERQYNFVIQVELLIK